MKLLGLLLLIATSSFGQDSLFFEYVNDYRLANGVEALEFDSELHKVSKLNTFNMELNDSLMHSGTDTYECATRLFSLAPTQVDLNSFNKFLETYYGESYTAPLGDNDDPAVIDYTLLYVVYSWDSSAQHRAVMLTEDATIGSCNIDLGDINFKANYKTIGGQKIYFKKFIAHYSIDAVATLNLNL